MRNTLTPSPVPRELQLGRASRFVGRALRRRCPNCGGGSLFRSWLQLKEVCPDCDLRTDRWEPDYFLGSFVINFVVAELLICAGALLGILLTWPDVPWVALKWGLILFMIPTPALFYPYAKTLWLAIDLTFRPLTLADLEGHGENLPRARAP
jgi:uncharacterized protein (DUF983 family)